MKKIIAGLMSVTLAFGCLTLPAEVSDKFGSGSVITANAEISGAYNYSVLNDGTVEITNYFGVGKAVTIPSTIGGKKVTRIGDKAFYQSTSLTSVTIPSGVTSIGRAAFSGCSSLSDLTIPNSVKEIGNMAFGYCSSLTNVTIPSSVTNIKDHAFANCSDLKSITIPNGVKNIGNSVFWNCTSLTSVSIPSSVTSIGDSAFYNCKSLKSITVNSNNKYYSSASGVLFNKDKTALIQYPTANTAESYTIPSSVTSIYSYAFPECSSLKSVAIPNGMKRIDDYAFYGCASMTSVTIPKSITAIGEYAFSDCASLKSMTIPSSVTSIGRYAFSNCSSLINAAIPSSVTSIGNNAFYGCTKLTHVIISDGIKDIGVAVFDACSSLTSVTIPKSVTSIGEAAFYGCADLKNVYFTGSKTQWNKISISSNNDALKNAVIHYSHTHSYKAAVTAPTYAAQGYTLHKCSCGDSYKDTYTAKKTVPSLTAKSAYTYTTNAVRINWNKVSGATGYKVFRYDPTTKKWTALKAIYDPNILTYKDSGLKSGTVYKYRVKAFVKSGGKFYFGKSCDTIMTTTKPTAPKITKANKTSSAVRLFWNKVTCSGYKIQRYNAATKKWVDVKKVSSATTNYKISSLKKNTSYKFRVLAYTYDGKKNVSGAWSYYTVKTAK